MKDLTQLIWPVLHWPTGSPRGPRDHPAFASPDAPQFLAVQPVFIADIAVQARRRRPRPKSNPIPTPPRPPSAR